MFLIPPQHKHQQYKASVLWKTAAAGVGVKSVITLTAHLIAGPGSGILQPQHLWREQGVHVFCFLHERFILSQNFVSVLDAFEKPVQVDSCLTINKPLDCFLVIVGVV